MKILTWSILVLSFILVLGVACNMLYPYPTIVVKSPAPVTNKELRAGDTVEVVLEYEKYFDGSCVVTRQFVDGTIYTMPSYTSNLPVGKHVRTDITTQIPNGLPPGRYHAEITLVYQFPPLRTINYRFVTEEFDVVK